MNTEIKEHGTNILYRSTDLIQKHHERAYYKYSAFTDKPEHNCQRDIIYSTSQEDFIVFYGAILDSY
jgi:hypothetical protein